MSASLVGSEMCIRDRPRCALPPRGRVRAPRPLRKSTRRYARAPPSKAVSYTHLTLPTICSV
eukprot:11880389-Alexandrium_andersonii.AAC.1